MSDDRDIKEVKVNNKDTDKADFEHRRKNFIKEIEKSALKYKVDIVAILKYGQQDVIAKIAVLDLEKKDTKTN